MNNEEELVFQLLEEDRKVRVERIVDERKITTDDCLVLGMLIQNRQMAGLGVEIAGLHRRIDETNTRIDALRHETNNRFDETNNRIDALRHETNSRLDETNSRIDALRHETNSRLDETNNRIDALRHETDNGINALRHETMEKIEELGRRLGNRIESNFKWVISLLMLMWVTIILAILVP
ncbi:MAG: hypothetical protein WAV32_10360 [Halobacteriota archaeon]